MNYHRLLVVDWLVCWCVGLSVRLSVIISLQGGKIGLHALIGALVTFSECLRGQEDL